MTKDVEKWWDEASPYFQEEAKLSTKTVQYGPFGSTENKLKLLGNIKNKKILEIGCGGAQCSIAFAKKGAKCTGIDVSRKQIEYAKVLIRKNKVNVKVIKGDIQTLPYIQSNGYDIVFSAMALQYIPNLTTSFKEVYRVLKKGGLFVFSLDHPFYRTISPKDLKIKKSYNKTGKEEHKEVWPDGSKHKFVIYKRKVSDMVNRLVEAKFHIEKMVEPLDLSYKGLEKDFPKRLAKLVGPTIIFKARKKYKFLPKNL